CAPSDLDANGAVTIGELIKGIRALVGGCAPSVDEFVPFDSQPLIVSPLLVADAVDASAIRRARLTVDRMTGQAALQLLDADETPMGEAIALMLIRGDAGETLLIADDVTVLGHSSLHVAVRVAIDSAAQRELVIAITAAGTGMSAPVPRGGSPGDVEQ